MHSTCTGHHTCIMVRDILSHYQDFCVHCQVQPLLCYMISLSVRFRFNLAFRGRTAMNNCNRVIYLF